MTPVGIPPGARRAWRLPDDPVVAILAVAAVWIATILVLPPNGFWVVDNSIKLLQVKALVSSDWGSTTLPWPGAELDPGYQYNPLPGVFSVVREGELHSHFAPAFALVSTVPYKLFGNRGLTLLPLAGGLLILAGLARLGRRLGLPPAGRSLAVIIAGLATPVWFYSVTFWEHTIAVGLAIWSLDALFAYISGARVSSLARSALLAGAAVMLRDEYYLLLPLLLAVALVSRPDRRPRACLVFLAGVSAAILPLWLINGHYTGSPFGHHLASNWRTSRGLASHLAGRGLAFWRLFMVAHPSPWISILASAPHMALLVLRPAWPGRILHRAAAWAALIASAGFLAAFAAYFSGTSPLIHLLRSNGLFAVAPILVLAFIRESSDDRKTRLRNLLWSLLLAYLLLYWLAAPSSSTRGIHWANRFLLIYYPVAALLCAATLASRSWRVLLRSRLLAVSVALAVTLSVAAQIYSIGLLRKALDFSTRLNAAVAEAPEQAVVTRTWFLPGYLQDVFLDKKIFLLRGRDGELPRLKAMLTGAGYRRVLVVDVVAHFPRPLAGASNVRVVDDGGLGYYTVSLSDLDLP